MWTHPLLSAGFGRAYCRNAVVISGGRLITVASEVEYGAAVSLPLGRSGGSERRATCASIAFSDGEELFNSTTYLRYAVPRLLDS